MRHLNAPPLMQHEPWIERLETQLEGAVSLMESAVTASTALGHDWLLGEQICQADISVAVAWRFMMHIDRVRLDPIDYPALSAYSLRAEELPQFSACPLS